MQRISVARRARTSHFARVLVAADYRMKRSGDEFDPSPVRGLPSYLQMVKPRNAACSTPRFWLEPKYEALLRDADGLALELRGSGVKAMTEEDFVTATGNVQHSGKASPLAQEMGRQHDRRSIPNWPWPIRSSASCRTAWNWPSSGRWW